MPGAVHVGRQAADARTSGERLTRRSTKCLYSAEEKPRFRAVQDAHDLGRDGRGASKAGSEASVIGLGCDEISSGRRSTVV